MEELLVVRVVRVWEFGTDSCVYVLWAAILANIADNSQLVRMGEAALLELDHPCVGDDSPEDVLLE